MLGCLIITVLLRQCIADTVVCRPVNFSLVSHCTPYIPGNIWIPQDYNESEADVLAYDASQLPSTDQCPFFSNLFYQCNKYFIHCLNGSAVGTNATVEGMCNTVCYRSQTGDQCDNYDVKPECGNLNLYDPPPFCYDIPYGLVGTNNKWQYILGGIVAGLGVIIACGLLYQWIKKITWRPDPHAPIEFEDEKGKLEKEQKAGQNYQDLNVAKPFNSGDEYRTAQQARSEMIHRESMRRSTMGNAPISSSVPSNTDTKGNELSDAVSNPSSTDEDHQQDVVHSSSFSQKDIEMT